MEEIVANHVRYARIIDFSNAKAKYYRHVHNCFELYLFVDGDAEYYIEDRMYKLKPYTLLLIKPMFAHYIKIKNPDAIYERVTVHFEKSGVAPELFQVLENETEIYYLDKDSEIIKCYSRLKDACGNFAKLDLSLLLPLYLNEIIIRIKNEQPVSSAAYIVNHTVSKILNYINENIKKPLDIKTISQDLFLAPTYISHIFAKHLRTSVMQYIKQKKVFMAQNLIRSGVKPTKAAQAYGFDNYSTFYRLYKSILKNTPSLETEKLTPPSPLSPNLPEEKQKPKAHPAKPVDKRLFFWDIPHDGDK